MRRSEAPVIVYSVEISPPAWTQLAQLTVETYRRIRDELDAVAVSLTEGSRRPGLRRLGIEASPEAPSLVVDGTVARYAVDHERGRVLLLEVAHPLSSDSE